MRSMRDAGIGDRPRFVKATDIDDRPFVIIHAYLNPNGYNGQPEFVAHLRMMDGQPVAYDEDGLAIGPDVSWSASPTPSRDDIVRAFESSREAIGPCQFQFIPTRNGSPFAHIVEYVDLDATPLDVPSSPSTERAVAQRTAPPRESARSRRASRPAPSTDDELEELPF